MADVNWRRHRVADSLIDPSIIRALHIDHGEDVTWGQLDLKNDSELLRSAYIGRRTLDGLRAVIARLKAEEPVDPPIFVPTNAMDWSLLGRAVQFYVSKGFVYTEAPWAVSRRAVEITCPNPQWTAAVDGLGALVGSAEQSFLYLATEHHLPAIEAGQPGYVACTPCFRLGDTEDGWHFPYFMKVELFVPGNALLDLFKFLQFAGECFRELGADVDMLKTVQTDQGVDILLNGYEIGSFGLRKHECEDGRMVEWVYGTGLALPRFSQALAAGA